MDQGKFSIPLTSLLDSSNFNAYAAGINSVQASVKGIQNTIDDQYLIIRNQLHQQEKTIRWLSSYVSKMKKQERGTRPYRPLAGEGACALTPIPPPSGFEKL